MRFAFSEEQRLLQESLREFLAVECTPERVRALWSSETGRAPELWARLAELGVPGLRVPEAFGGLGLDELDLVLLLEEAGRAALPEPLVETAALGAPLLRELGSDELARRWLPRVASGEALLAVGHPVDALVVAAHAADLLLLGSGDEIHAVPRDAVELEREPCLDPSRRLFRVSWSPSRATRAAAGAPGRALLAATLDRGALASAAQLLGAGQQLVDRAVRHACEREQFGVPIGSFQAVKHLLADVQVRLEFARPVVYRAAHSVARGTPHRSLDVSHAKLAAGEAARRAARAALQVHGAIGYTWEQDLHIWMKRVWALDAAWGTGAFHRARVADGILSEGAPLGPGGLDAD